MTDRDDLGLLILVTAWMLLLAWGVWLITTSPSPGHLSPLRTDAAVPYQNTEDTP